jgi:hypothetical protein
MLRQAVHALGTSVQTNITCNNKTAKLTLHQPATCNHKSTAVHTGSCYSYNHNNDAPHSSATCTLVLQSAATLCFIPGNTSRYVTYSSTAVPTRHKVAGRWLLAASKLSSWSRINILLKSSSWRRIAHRFLATNTLDTFVALFSDDVSAAQS